MVTKKKLLRWGTDPSSRAQDLPAMAAAVGARGGCQSEGWHLIPGLPINQKVLGFLPLLPQDLIYVSPLGSGPTQLKLWELVNLWKTSGSVEVRDSALTEVKTTARLHRAGQEDKPGPWHRPVCVSVHPAGSAPPALGSSVTSSSFSLWFWFLIWDFFLGCIS